MRADNGDDYFITRRRLPSGNAKVVPRSSKVCRGLGGGTAVNASSDGSKGAGTRCQAARI